jgi:dolichol-phosphate hexosyltransferase
MEEDSTPSNLREFEFRPTSVPGQPLVIADSFESANAAIILPTLNEERGLERTLQDIPFDRLAASGWRVRPLVVDGGSTDKTLEVATRWGVPILHQRSRGKGGAIREALEWLSKLRVRYAVVLDADATYPGASVLPALELMDAGSELVVGVRQSASGPPRSARDLVHRIGNALLNLAAGQLSRAAILDVCSGFWGVHVDRTLELGLVSNDFGIEAELFLKAQRARWTVHQIPIPYRERVGEAKLHAVSDGVRILLSIIRFGHRSIQESPPASSLLPAFVRDVLVTALVGGGELVLVTPPSRVDEARAVAFLLERSDLRPRVMVRAEDSDLPPSEDESAGAGSANERPAGALSPQMASSVALKEYVGPVIRFGRARRMLYVELPNLSASPTPPSVQRSKSRGVSRSGAYLSRPRAPGDILDPIRMLASRLNSDHQGVRERFLEANGISLQGVYEGPGEYSEDSFEPQLRPRVDVTEQGRSGIS